MAPHNSSQPTIERASPSDIDAVAELWVRLARDQRAYDSVVRADDNRETMREALAAHQVNDGLFVARLEGELVGFASFTVEHGSLELDATRGHLSNIYVEPDVRSRGIGTALLEAVEDALADRGVEVLVLEVMADNEAARRFYDRHGYDTHRVAMTRSLEDRKQSENDTHSKEDH
ncbi:GNAT family N-acetyltransferase [Natronorubrum aibiense]|uniref:GNAT family N-acetyltransferase n=1 Tax=Natronorubrum aibiense TaxID=348826 RepID=A0A5P9P5U4_9EURY|nr:GNAT family N-acetyltransferase [Natronorubrum aibiense]QFU83535.1 GNAT family N-acetyltransferase [Natronorubrum aibiense]